MNAVNDMFGREAVPVAQGDIQHFELAQTAVNGDGTNYRRVIFYTQKEKNDEGLERSRLYGLYLEPVVRETCGITFMGTGTSYFTIVPDEIPSRYEKKLPSPMMLCSLPELLKPVVEMRTAITQAPAVSAGSFEDISMALMNAGNLGVATF